jgi:hypothetical protein
MSQSFLARAKRAVVRKPSVEVHIPISPTPAFFNMVQCLALSIRKFGGICRDSPIILTVGDSTIDRTLEARYPWLGPLGVELRWVPEAFFREHSYYATGATRLWHDFRSDLVLLLDADILVASPFDEMIRQTFREGHVAGVIGPASPIQFFTPEPTWEAIYRHCGIEQAPDLCHEHTGWPYYFSSDEAYRFSPAAYFNYGVICAPSSLVTQIGKTYFSDLVRIRDFPPNGLISQIALTTSIVRLGLPTRALPMQYNFPNHPLIEALHGAELPLAKFLHLKDVHQFEKFELFGDLANVRAAIRRSDLRGVNEMARRVFQAIEPDLVDPVPSLVAA